MHYIKKKLNTQERNSKEQEYVKRKREIQEENLMVLKLFDDEVSKHEIEKVKDKQQKWKEKAEDLLQKIVEKKEGEKVKALKDENRMIKESFMMYQNEQEKVICCLQNEVYKLTKMVEEIKKKHSKNEENQNQ